MKARTCDGLWRAIVRLPKVSENILLSPVELYTDGACRGQSQELEGWGALLRSGSRQKELFGCEENTTNNRMELMAAIRGLEAVEGHSQVVHLHRLTICVQGYYRMDSKLETEGDGRRHQENL